MPKVSAIVLTYNNETGIKRCLDALSWVHELIIIDSYSTDRTLAIARQYTDHIYQRDYQKYARTRNWGLSLASYEWVLHVDSDEEYVTSVVEEIQAELLKEQPDIVGYSVPLQHICFGRKMRYWRRDERKVRLFRKRR